MKAEDIIQINASPEVVWAVTADVERWPEWTPTVETVKRLDDGSFEVGSTALIKQPRMPESRWVVTDCTPGKGFTWKTENRGMQIIATHAIKSDKSGTQNLLRLEMSGFLAVLMWPFIRPAVLGAIRQENLGLKKRCEK